MYLSASTKQFFDSPDLFGCMLSYRTTGGQTAALEAGCKWMLDNGAFTGNFEFNRWVNMLLDLQPYRETCLGIIVPDKPFDAAETLRRFSLYQFFPRCLGYKIALATQDGLMPDHVPWNLLDVLFIGGSDEHKRGIEATRLAKAAKQRGKWVHVARVSSQGSIEKYWSWADSFDGTTFKWDGGTNPVVKKMKTISQALMNIQNFEQWGML